MPNEENKPMPLKKHILEKVREEESESQTSEKNKPIPLKKYILEKVREEESKSQTSEAAAPSTSSGLKDSTIEPQKKKQKTKHIEGQRCEGSIFACLCKESCTLREKCKSHQKDNDEERKKQEERRENRKEYMRRYMRRYMRTYLHSDKGKEYLRAYNQSEQGKEVNKLKCKRYYIRQKIKKAELENDLAKVEALKKELEALTKN